MAEPFLGEIMLFAGNFAPRGYLQCNGQLLAISSSTALFSLLGTQYGGNGSTTFALPDFRGRVAVNQGNGPGLTPYTMGQQTGTETVTLLTTQMPAHTHQLSGGTTASTTQVTGTPANNTVFTNSAPGQVWINTATSLIAMAPQTVGITGGSQPHSNMQPYLAVTWCIANSGVYPSRN